MEGECMAVIKLEDVTFTYATAKEPSIKNISLSMEKGKFYALVGANGSGKTTICNVIRGFAPHFYTGQLQGNVSVFNQDISNQNLGQLSESIGFVFQNPFVQISGSKDTVFEEVAFGLENLGIDVDKIKKRVNEILKLVEIEELRDKNPLELSGGQKQRVALAAILAMDPPIMVIDEPTSQLDPQGTEDIFKIIKLLKQQGKTILLVEHKIESIAEYADYIYVLDKGELVMHGTTKEVFTKDELLCHCVSLPCYAHAGLELRREAVELLEIPVNKEEALAVFKKG